MAYRTEIEKLEQRHAENPKQWFAALADAYRKQGDVDLAIEYVKGGIEMRPDYASAHIVLGRCYLDKDMDNDAADAFEEVLQLDAENIIALKSLAEISERRGDEAGAREWLKRLLEVDPMNDEALECLERLGPEEEQAEVAARPSEIDQMASELGAETRETDDVEAPSHEMPEPIGLVPTVSEGAVDAASVDVTPITLDEAPPVDESPQGLADETPAAIEPMQFGAIADEGPATIGQPDVDLPGPSDEAEAVIEPVEIERPEFGADSVWTDEAAQPLDIITEEAEGIHLVSSQPDKDDLHEAADRGSAAIEPIDLEPAGDGASSLLEGISGFEEPVAEEESITAELEPIELETSDDDASSLVSGFGDAAGGSDEMVVDGGEEAKEGVADQRGSVPPTKEVSAVELEALRAADEMVSGPDVPPDAGMPDEPDESPLLAADAGTPEEQGESPLLAADADVVHEPDTLSFVAADAEPPEELIPETLEEPIPEIEDFAEVPADLVPEGITDRGIPEIDEDIDTDADEAIEEFVVEEILESDEAPELVMPAEFPVIDEMVEGGVEDAVVAAEAADESAPDEDIPLTAEIDAAEIERLRQLDERVAAEDMGEEQEGEREEEEGEEAEVMEAVVAEALEVADEAEVAEDAEVAEVAEGDEAPSEVIADELTETQTDAPLPLIMPEEEEVVSSDTTEPEPVVTETMAEVYAKQGLYDQAREIYEVLAKQHPDDPRLKACVEDLNRQATGAIQETRQSRFAVAATGGESAVTYLQQIFQPLDGLDHFAPASAPEAPQEPEFDPEPTPLEQAFSEDPPAAPGEPTVPAADEVSLASVFDGSAPDTTSPEAAPDAEEGVSYDEFYGTMPPSESSDETDGEDDSSDDDENFKNWLKGLKT